MEIPDEKVKELNITDQKISFEELERKVALREMIQAMHQSQQSIKGTAIENWTLDDINHFIQEAKDHYADENSVGH